MSDLVPRLGDALEELRRGRSLASRETAKAVEQEHSQGLVHAARVRARGHVAEEALASTARLSRDEERFARWAPLGETRYRAIVDAYALYAAYEVGRP